MYRRRRRGRDKIAFSFDSFLDVVANVIGIVVRLILVAWVGARSYSASMQQADDPPANVRDLQSASAADDPVASEMETMRRELADARLRLLEQLGSLQLAEAESNATREQLAELEKGRQTLDEVSAKLGVELAAKGARTRQAIVSAEELRKRGKEVLAQIKALESQPRQTQTLRYHTPVSRAVHADEMFFECRNGRVTFINLPAFLQEVNAGLQDKAAVLKTQWQVAGTTSQVGAFRLRYTIEREKNALEGIATGPVSGSYRYGLSEWTVEPMADDRGEPIELALKQNSAFRQRVDQLDPQITVVTFWVYADSFELFRRLRDHLYERGVEVAGRPLNEGSLIMASRHGTASRGQ
jgi:hypothetical protein